MVYYWLRIAAAWLLLRLASSVVKDAEKLLRQSADAKQVPSPSPEVVDAEVVTA